MAIYEFGRIDRLAMALKQAGIDQDTINEIMADGDLVLKNDKPEKKVKWFQEAMNRMDASLDYETRRTVREACACCLGGERLKISKKIGNAHTNLDDAIKAANEAKLVFGHSVTMDDDGRIHVSFQPENLDNYQCYCLRKAKEPVSITYCYCCGGHVKHHLQIALGRKLACNVQSSALASEGKKPCTFMFSIEE